MANPGSSADNSFSELMRRVIAAADESTRLIAETNRIRTISQELRSAAPERDPLPSARATPGIVWATPDGRTTCAIVRYSASAYEVTVTVDDVVVSAETFMDPVEASDAAERLRHEFLDGPH